ncbi:polysaccharide deacetylase family protein [Permianibacter sp. IMCC34836]|uniref:polysaccharide deacetylase family protein n=1 Tax=Permianibacter fluminis TaxID=2738515 RepID=UPI0015539156|nr:polysaccharide deacetylase family protein [Permianibacter fluminis]NQD35612.1 polysaccharide deacetylase family protein [Permianibacter fluminis]
MSSAFRFAYRLRLLPQRHHVFIFHRVVAERDPLMRLLPTVAEFAQQLERIRAAFTVIPLADSLDRQPDGTPTASITFDDGYRDNHELVLPLLQRLQLHATFFIATAFTDGDLMWNDWLTEAVRQHASGELDLTQVGLGKTLLSDDIEQRRSVLGPLRQKLKYLPAPARMAVVAQLRSLVPEPPRLMMNASELNAMQAAGMTLGGHTHDHHVLATLTTDEARWQIQHNRQRLTELLGSAPTLFAYPNGKPGQDYRREHVELVREAGYRAAWTTEHGAWNGRSDCFQIPRFTPWRWDGLGFARQLAEISFKTPQLLPA